MLTCASSGPATRDSRRRGGCTRTASRLRCSRRVTASAGASGPQQLADGTPIDRGGAWLGPAHDAMFGLAREMGVSTYKTWVKGKHLLVDGERTRRYTGLIPKISPLAIGTIAWAQLKLDRMAKQVPLEAPWTRDARRRMGCALRRRLCRSTTGSAPRSRATCSRWRCAGCSPAT